MPKILILRGLPASGKTTWAKAQKDYTRVNKDDLRAMLHDSKWTKHNEKLVLNVRDAIIGEALEQGRNVIVDDTNMSDTHYNRIKSKFPGVSIEVKEFDIEPKEAIKRDLARPKSVGSEVIMQMYDQFVKPAPPVYVPPEGKPHAIIVDIDGTIAHMDGRGPYDLAKVDTDKFDLTVAEIADFYTNGTKATTILLSGREDSARDDTIKWLADKHFDYDHLYMRKAGDMRKDFVVKRELFEENVQDNYQVDFVLDDRDQVVNMWRNELGLKCLQVAPGNF